MQNLEVQKVYWRCIENCDEDYCNQCMYNMLPKIQPNYDPIDEFDLDPELLRRYFRRDSYDDPWGGGGMEMRMTIPESMSYQ